jgi:hypothetical protein
VRRPRSRLTASWLRDALTGVLIAGVVLILVSGTATAGAVGILLGLIALAPAGAPAPAPAWGDAESLGPLPRRSGQRATPRLSATILSKCPAAAEAAQERRTDHEQHEQGNPDQGQHPQAGSEHESEQGEREPTGDVGSEVASTRPEPLGPPAALTPGVEPEGVLEHERGRQRARAGTGAGADGPRARLRSCLDTLGLAPFTPGHDNDPAVVT